MPTYIGLFHKKRAEELGIDPAAASLSGPHGFFNCGLDRERGEIYVFDAIANAEKPGETLTKLRESGEYAEVLFSGN